MVVPTISHCGEPLDNCHFPGKTNIPRNKGGLKYFLGTFKKMDPQRDGSVWGINYLQVMIWYELICSAHPGLMCWLEFFFRCHTSSAWCAEHIPTNKFFCLSSRAPGFNVLSRGISRNNTSPALLCISQNFALTLWHYVAKVQNTVSFLLWKSKRKELLLQQSGVCELLKWNLKMLVLGWVVPGTEPSRLGSMDITTKLGPEPTFGWTKCWGLKV